MIGDRDKENFRLLVAGALLLAVFFGLETWVDKGFNEGPDDKMPLGSAVACAMSVLLLAGLLIWRFVSRRRG